MTFDGQGQYEVDGQNYFQDRDRPRGNFESVSDKYFSTLGLKILEGRDFSVDDSDAKQPVAIVNASFARKFYGRESPLGRRIRIYNPAQPQPWRTIVGVVPDTLMQGHSTSRPTRPAFICRCSELIRPRNFAQSLFVQNPDNALIRSPWRCAKQLPSSIQIYRLISRARRYGYTMKFWERTASSRHCSESSESSHSFCPRLVFTA